MKNKLLSILFLFVLAFGCVNAVTPSLIDTTINNYDGKIAKELDVYPQVTSDDTEQEKFYFWVMNDSITSKKTMFFLPFEVNANTYFYEDTLSLLSSNYVNENNQSYIEYDGINNIYDSYYFNGTSTSANKSYFEFNFSNSAQNLTHWTVATRFRRESSVSGSPRLFEFSWTNRTLINSSTDSIVTTAGTPSGNITDIQTEDGNLYNVSETATTPAFTTYVNLSMLPYAQQLKIVGTYQGNPAHTVEVSAYNYTSLTWNLLGTIPSTNSTLLNYTFNLTSEHSNSEGKVQIVINHTSPGNPTHVLNLDRIYLSRAENNIYGLNALITNTPQVTVSGDLLSSVTLSSGVWYDLVITYDGTYRKIYINNLLIHTKTVYNFTLPLMNIDIGNHRGSSYTRNLYKFKMDDFKIWNYALNTNEINDRFLYKQNKLDDTVLISNNSLKVNVISFNNDNYSNVVSSNTVMISSIYDIFSGGALFGFSNVSSYTQSNIINTLEPQNEELINLNSEYSFTLNYPSNCIIYLNSQLNNEVLNTITYTMPIHFTEGTNNLLLYCYYFVNNTSVIYDTKFTEFEARDMSDTTSINFILTGTDFNIRDESLYLVSPCLKTQIKGFEGEYSNVFNPDGVYITKIDSNGYANLDVPIGSHELCVFNGLINYDTENKTTDYTIINAYGQIKIGVLDVPNTLTQNYEISLDKFEIYSKLNPKAWNTTWIAILPSLLLFILGIMLIFVGVKIQEGSRVIIFGTICIILALGFSLGSLFFLIF